ncbi:MAG: acetyltransferase [Solirubrobacterales bacterium]|nr:acetyltransferase [Solirubrobacterales bacterium]
MTGVFAGRSTEALAAAVEASNTELFRALVLTLDGGWVRDDGDALEAGCGVDFPLFNGVLRTGLAVGQADRRIDDILARRREDGRDWLWWVWPSSAPADLGERLAARGLEPFYSAPGMWVDLDAVAHPSPVPGLRIERVGDPASVEAWLSVVAPAFALPAPATDAFRGLAAAGARGDTPVSDWVGFAGGEPVAVASLGIAAGVAGIFNVATRSDARQRGYGSALTAHVLAQARAAGQRTAALTASALGRGSYERLGFREVTRVTPYAPAA